MIFSEVTICICYRYLKQKRNNSGGDQIVPWRVSNNQQHNYESKVPINATLISATFAAIATTGIICWIKYRNVYGVILNATMVIISALQLPLVLGFTINHQKRTSKTNPIVPNTLQFHGEDVDFDDQDNNNETQDQGDLAMEVFIANLQNPRSPQLEEDPINSFRSDDTIDISVHRPENVDDISQLPGQVCYM